MGNLAIYLLPGMTATITAVKAFAEMGEVNHTKPDGNIEKLPTKNGFIVGDKTIGDIEPIEGSASVKYTHKKYSPNTITFYARNSAIGRVDIISVPIHDHASIVTGGPAFGTYFSDDETVGDGAKK